MGKMKKTEFKIPIYDFDVTILEVESKEDKAEVNAILSNLTPDKESIDEVLGYIEDGSMNGGDTFRNLLRRKFVVVLYPFKDIETRREVVNHEKRHIEDRVLEYCGISDIEASAYLAGYISKFMY
jgi:hypothetical protein